MSATKDIAVEARTLDDSVWLIDGRYMAERGMNDALAGKSPATEHPYYGEAFAHGDRLRRAADWHLVLGLEYGTRCPGCGCQWLGHSDSCPGRCDNGSARLQHGLFCVYGPYDPGESPDFISLERLRQLIVGGLQVVNMHGVCLSPEILIQ